VELTEALKATYLETAQALKSLGRGGQRRAARELGGCRATIRKGLRELESGQRWVDNLSARGRKKAEEKLPNLLADIGAMVDEQRQTDPTFASVRLDTRLSAAEVRRQLIQQQG
jgi:hypothetical protein